MKFKSKIYKQGDTRIRLRYAWFPIIIWNHNTNEREIRWLEWVTTKQVYYSYMRDSGWEDVEFLDAPERSVATKAK